MAELILTPERFQQITANYDVISDQLHALTQRLTYDPTLTSEERRKRRVELHECLRPGTAEGQLRELSAFCDRYGYQV